jgi:hypothetical protein
MHRHRPELPGERLRRAVTAAADGVDEPRMLQLVAKLSVPALEEQLNGHWAEVVMALASILEVVIQGCPEPAVARCMVDTHNQLSSAELRH